MTPTLPAQAEPDRDAWQAGATLWQLIECRATHSPGAVMLIDDQLRRMTFDEYRRCAEAAAAGLVAQGVAPASPVSWQLPTSIEAVVLMGALARLGASQNPILPVLRAREVGYILDQTEASAFIVPEVVRGFDHAALAHDLARARNLLPIVVGDRPPSGPLALALPDGDPRGLPAPPARADEVRWRYYTSGTTADPKGVQHTDHSVMAGSNALVRTAHLGPDDVVFAPVPVTHIGGVMFVSAALRTGCGLALVDGFDPATTPHLAAAAGTTVLAAVGPMFPAFFAAQREHGISPLLPRLRLVFTGGAAVPPSLHSEVRARLGGLGVAAPWGMTEAPQITFPELDASDEQLAGTVGRPAPGVEIRVADPAGVLLPPGVEGELLVDGPQRLVGYVDAALDATAFDEHGFLRTGDVGWIGDDGYVRVTGRVKDIIIRNGENISAQEVEQVLLTHAVVADAAVVGLPDSRTGERCCAILQLLPGATLALAEVRAHFDAARVARHKVPEQIELVDAIPRNDMGKAQKHILRQNLIGSAAASSERETPS